MSENDESKPRTTAPDVEKPPMVDGMPVLPAELLQALKDGPLDRAERIIGAHDGEIAYVPADEAATGVLAVEVAPPDSTRAVVVPPIDIVADPSLAPPPVMSFRVHDRVKVTPPQNPFAGLEGVIVGPGNDRDGYAVRMDVDGKMRLFGANHLAFAKPTVDALAPSSEVMKAAAEEQAQRMQRAMAAKAAEETAAVTAAATATARGFLYELQLDLQAKACANLIDLANMFVPVGGNPRAMLLDAAECLLVAVASPIGPGNNERPLDTEMREIAKQALVPLRQHRPGNVARKERSS